MAVLDTEVRGIAVVSDDMTDIEQVFKKYGPSISYFFANRGFSPEESRDLTQDTFVKALGGLSNFRGEAKMETWLLRIAANVWKNAIRSKRAVKRDAPTVSLEAAMEQGERVGQVERPESKPSPASPQDRLLESERRRLLREAVAVLPSRMRRCVTLRIDRGLKYREIASIMQVSVDTVKTQLYQARLRLKGELQEYFDLESAG